MQLMLTASVVPQLFIATKAALDDAIEVNVTAAVPVFVSIELCAALLDPAATVPKPRLLGVMVSAGTPAPVPLRETV
jgi:hypothetical protein